MKSRNIPPMPSWFGKAKESLALHCNTSFLVDLDKINMIILHPDDYVDCAEKGYIKSFIDAGFKVEMSDMMEKGKIIANGEKAVELMELLGLDEE